jgi:hypothetical protein
LIIPCFYLFDLQSFGRTIATIVWGDALDKRFNQGHFHLLSHALIVAIHCDLHLDITEDLNVDFRARRQAVAGFVECEWTRISAIGRIYNSFNPEPEEEEDKA